MLEQVGHGVGGLHQMLEIVQDQQQLARAQVGGDLRLEIAAGDLDAKALGDGHRH